MPNRIDRRLLAEFSFLAVLIALPALPLIAWRGSPLFFAVWPLAAICGCWLVLLGAWLATTSAIPDFVVPDQVGAGDTARASRFVRPVIAVLLLLLTIVAFYLPLRINFWGGVDESPSFEADLSAVWSDGWDKGLGRPLVGLPAYIATHVMPGRIEGFLWVAVFLCFANGWLLFLLLGRLMHRATAIPVLAAILLIVHRGDPLRFFPMWASNHYETMVFLLLLAFWLFLLSYERQNRALLMLACGALGCALLTNESAYPSAALIPIIGLAVRQDRKRYAVWAFAWYGTVGLLSARLVVHLLAKGHDSYQGGHFKELLQQPGFLFLSISEKLRPALAYFQTSTSWKGYAAYASGAFVLAALSVLVARRSLPRERVNFRALSLAGVAIVCGLLPFLPIKTTLRTQLLVAPAEATLVALAIGLIVRALPARIRTAVVVLVAGLLAANTTVGAIDRQLRCPSSVRFERMVHLFRQIHGVSPSFAPDTLLVFVLEDPDRSPVGFNYMLAPVARDILGVEANQAHYNDPFHSVPRFTADRVIATDGRNEREFTYKQVVAFGVKEDGTATLLSHLPPELLPGPECGAGYDPVACMRSGPFAELPYFRYPVWCLPFGDVVASEEGVMLGDGWGPLLAEGSDAYRIALDGAELVVNPQGADRRAVTLELEPGRGTAGEGSEIEVRDSSGAPVAVAPLAGRSVVHLTVPLDPERVSLFRLFVRPSAGSATMALAPGSVRVRAYRRGIASEYAPLPRDIFRDGLLAGRGWYTLEDVGGRTFHWVSGDAEVDLRYFSGASPELALAAEAGPGCSGQPCVLEIRDDSNRLLVTRTFRRREELRVPLPPGYNGRLHLHVVGGGTLVTGDPRVLDYRVFTCGAVQH